MWWIFGIALAVIVAAAYVLTRRAEPAHHDRARA